MYWAQQIIVKSHCRSVVNCFQFVSLMYWAQPPQLSYSLPLRCELLSVCIFDVLSTANVFLYDQEILLWIAFSLYLWCIEHSINDSRNVCIWVVNCFQFVSLMYWAQPLSNICPSCLCCELLSVCIFDVLSTASVWNFFTWNMLWIAFSLYLWCIEHSKKHTQGM